MSGLAASDTLLRLTASLGDRYRVERQIGQGGMAIKGKREFDRILAVAERRVKEFAT